MEKLPSELRINKACASCGNSNVVPLTALDSRPTCSHCAALLDITEFDIASAKAMMAFAADSGEHVGIG
jgi:hypothetical protein